MVLLLFLFYSCLCFPIFVLNTTMWCVEVYLFTRNPKILQPNVIKSKSLSEDLHRILTNQGPRTKTETNTQQVYNIKDSNMIMPNHQHHVGGKPNQNKGINEIPNQRK